MIGGYLGARYTNRLSERSLKRLIGLVLIVVAATMFLRVFGLGADSLVTKNLGFKGRENVWLDCSSFFLADDLRDL
jgi:hypothetical protein